MMSNRLCGL